MEDRDSPGGALLEHHAFLLQWGTSEEIGRRVAEVRGTAGWWASREGDAGEEGVGEGLGRVLAALSRLRDSARRVEAALEAGGYEFDRYLRVIRRTRRESTADTPPGGTGDPMLQETIGTLVEELREAGEASENTLELRIRIRGRLARSLHPDLLTDAVIRSGVDRVLGSAQPERE
ncbi:MAG: hypothetical protein OXT72_09840 [Gammaproteobacteria bacterium]|nr:hypothetical protein [Gammaproteobacteria bacterium]MDE0248668.1 hypothetical protein [Gammaproteobacteria bacterium]